MRPCGRKHPTGVSSCGLTRARPRTAGRSLEQWQIKVSGAGRIWYLPDDDKHTVWVIYASAAHPKQTD